jgi:hypothetical protein
MRRLLLPAMLLFALASQGQIRNSIKREKIKNLFALMHQDSLVVKTLDAMTSSMVKNMSTIFSDTTYTNHGVDVSKIMQKLTERSVKKSKENALRLLHEDMVDIYDKYFTLEEIEDFTTFYKSKAGQKLVNQMPNISKDVMSIVSIKYQKDLQQSFMKDVEEVTKEITEQMKTEKK